MDQSLEGQQEEARAALRGRIRANRFVALGVAALVLLTVYFWFRGTELREHALRMSAGDPLAHRHYMADILVQEAAKHGLEIELTPSKSSQDLLSQVARDELDIAMAFGDFTFPEDKVREVAVLQDEALHLFVKPALAGATLPELEGKTISLSSPGSSTHEAAMRLLSFVGLTPGVDFVERDFSHEELQELSTEELPDGIFAITSVPWEEVGEALVKQHGYRLIELPYAAAASLRNPAIRDIVIPAYSYSIDPPVPAVPLHTVGQRLLMVANRETSPAAIDRLMKVLFESEFSRRSRLPLLDPVAVINEHEFPLHEGTIKYLHRNEPLIKAEWIDKVENLRSFIVSAALALFLFWRWHKRRDLIGFETFLDAVSEIERAALVMERDDHIDIAELRRLRQRLSEIKTQALEFQSEGVLSNEEQMVSFLTHVFDVRSFLESLMSFESPRPAREVVPPTNDAAPSRPEEVEQQS